MNPKEETVGNGHNGNHPGFGARMGHMGDEAQHLISDAQAAVNDFVEAVDLKGRVDRHPYGMVLAAAGLGYVLGGGLFTPLTGRVVRLALRLAALPLVKDELIGLAEVAVDGLVEKAKGSSSGGIPGEG